MLSLDAPSVFSVSQLSRYMKEMLESDEILQNVWVRGEVSNYKFHAPSGHCYFTLKDADAQLPCAFFKYARLQTAAPNLRDGMAIAANGTISLFERDGKLQLYVKHIEALGDGALYLRFAQLKARLEAEGLFDPERKRSLPSHPSVIGIVTSPQAAALRDMLRVLASRYPLARIILSPAAVQGVDAAPSIANALDLLNAHGEAEVIIVGRGGGSLEDLWAFNEEVVARSIARSRIPVISAVGHETDFTIADFVADLRASTPTAAATAAVPDIGEWRSKIDDFQYRLVDLMQTIFADKHDELEQVQRDLARFSPQAQLDRHHQRLDDAVTRLQERVDMLLARRNDSLHARTQLLASLSPGQTVARGYAIVRRSNDQRIVTSVEHIRPGDDLTIQVTDGTLRATVRETQQEE